MSFRPLGESVAIPILGRGPDQAHPIDPGAIAKRCGFFAVDHRCPAGSLDCSCHQPIEVRECPVTRRDFWAYRLGRDPSTSPTRGLGKSSTYTGDFETGDAVP